jgi:hypothetical protein
MRIEARPGRSALTRALLVTVGILAVSGCAGPGDREGAAGSAALRWYAAVAAQDGTTACDLLAPETAGEVAESGDSPCAEAVLDEDLPDPGAVVSTAVFGQRAQVRLAGDTVFLAVFPGGWRVVAAGCTSRGERPYNCTVQGG